MILMICDPISGRLSSARHRGRVKRRGWDMKKIKENKMQSEIGNRSRRYRLEGCHRDRLASLSLCIHTLRGPETDILLDGIGQRFDVAHHAVFPPLADDRSDEAGRGEVVSGRSGKLSGPISGAAHGHSPS